MPAGADRPGTAVTGALEAGEITRTDELDVDPAQTGAAAAEPAAAEPVPAEPAPAEPTPAEPAPAEPAAAEPTPAEPAPAEPAAAEPAPAERAPAEPAPPARVVVLTGPSGVGKSTVVRTLRNDHPELWVSVSVTTRHPRPGERDGREYRFVDPETFDRLVAGGELLEWAHFAGNRYGTPRAPVLERITAGVPVLLEIDLQGARQVRASMPEAVQVFLAPPSWDELERRLVGRGTEAPEVVDRRLAAARLELAAESEFDHSIDNDDVGSVSARLLGLLGLQP